MNNSVIDFGRLGSLMKLNLHFNLRRMLYTAGIGIGMTLIICLYMLSLGTLEDQMYFNQHEYLFILSLYISGFVFSGNSFIRLRSLQSTRDYLMLPASSTEKFIIEVLLTTVLYPFLFFIIYWLFSLLFNAILDSVSQAFFMPFSLNVAPYQRALMVYFFIQSIFLFGAASFQKTPLIRTSLLFLLTVGFIVLFVYVAWFFYDLDKGMDELAMNKLFYSSAVYYRHYFVILLGLLFWVLTYLKLKEKEA